jgi:hypothetical protein
LNVAQTLTATAGRFSALDVAGSVRFDSGSVGFFGRSSQRADRLPADNSELLRIVSDCSIGCADGRTVAVVERLRDRVNALENALQAYGLLP